jgi:hypothetical protein
MKLETQIEQTNAEVAEELMKIWQTMNTWIEKWVVNVAKSIWTEDGINIACLWYKSESTKNT